MRGTFPYDAFQRGGSNAESAQPDTGSGPRRRRMNLKGTFPYDAYQRGGSNIQSEQPDQGNYSALRDKMRGNMENFDEIIKLLENRNIPPQLRQVPYVVTLASATTPPQILIPENKNRMSFLVAYVDKALVSPSLCLITYGPPPLPNVGLPLLASTPFGESNGTISIDDIVITPYNSASNLISYPATVIGFEGTLAIEAAVNLYGMQPR